MPVKLLLAFFLVALGSGLATAADPAPLSRADLDKRAGLAAFDAVSQGVELFNNDKYDECLRVYEGAITILRPLFDHHPELSKLIAESIEKSKGLKSSTDKAFVLRAALDEVIKLSAAKKAGTLWQRLGGEAAVKAVIHDFVGVAATNPKVNFSRDGKYKLDDKGVAALESMLVDLVSHVTGGPRKYTGRDMKTAHAGMKITEDEFNALAGDLLTTLKKYKVPQSEIDELIAIIGTTKIEIVEGKKKPLWDRLGGEVAVKAVVAEFLTTAAKDPKANIDRNGNYPLTKERSERVLQLVVEFVSSATGGPVKYSGRDMKNTHVGMKITEDEFNAAAGHLVAALKKFKVPQPEIDELVAIVSTTAKDMIEVKK